MSSSVQCIISSIKTRHCFAECCTLLQQSFFFLFQILTTDFVSINTAILNWVGNSHHSYSERSLMVNYFWSSDLFYNL